MLLNYWRRRVKKQEVEIGVLIWKSEKGTGRNSWPTERKIKTKNEKNEKDGKVKVTKVVKHGKVYTRNITGIWALEIVVSGMNQSGGYVPEAISWSGIFSPEIPSSLVLHCFVLYLIRFVCFWAVCDMNILWNNYSNL